MKISDNFSLQIRYFKDDIIATKNTILVKNRIKRKSHKHKFTYRQSIKIGVLLPTLKEERWIRDKEGMEARAKEKGVTVMIETANFDPYKQVSQLDKLISLGINVLILAPTFPENAPSLIEKANNAGIKVISYDFLARDSYVDLSISINAKRVGELQGLYLIQHVPRGNYLIMYGENGIVFKEGSMEYIQPLVNIGNIKIVGDKLIKGWDPQIAYTIVKDSLAANKNKIDAILAPNDATAGASIQALQEQGLVGKVAVTGQDGELAAIKRIIQGTQSMTVLKDTRELGSKAIDTAVKLVQGEPIDVTTEINNGKMQVPSILIEPVLIDKNNIDSEVIGRGFYTKEQIYGRKTKHSSSHLSH